MFDLSYSFVMPPTILIVVGVAASLYALIRPRLGIAVMLGASLLLYGSATPALSSFLLRHIEAQIPQPPYAQRAQAIVVLGGDVRRASAPGQPDTLGRLSLERVVYAARLYRRVKLPIAVSGGRIDGATQTLAALMRNALEGDFSVPVAWLEDRSLTTFQNAEFTAQMLKPAGISAVFVVTQPWHMPRALWSFKRVGLDPIPWPTPRTAIGWHDIGDFFPSPRAFLDTFRALHEMMGLAYYRLRY